MRRAVLPLLVVAVGVSTAGAPLTFAPEDPIAVAPELADASGVQPREITHFRDAWEAIWKRGDATVERALDVNTVDEVPDSSWFENRIGVRPMTTADIAAGPDHERPASGPWTITSAKSEGVTPGLQMKDSRGQLYFIKFDPPGYPELATGAEVISTKLLYAAGYHVPDNEIVVLARDDLRIGPTAMMRDSDGKKRPLTEADVDALLHHVARRPDGRYRALASTQLPGTPLGPFSYYGVRPDDPNDTVPHEHRRSLRGLRVFAAWINHVDVKSENSLDMLAADEGRRIVRHYLIDFNATLGSAGIGPADRRSGHEYILDTRPILLSLATLGLYVRPWMTIHYPDVPAVGRFEGDRFEPAQWKPTFPNRAMLNARPDDTFWAARRVMAFSDEAIRAVVATADYSDPRATDLIANTLIERRDKIGRAWLAGVNPLIDFAIDDDGASTSGNQCRAPMLTFRNAAADADISTPAAGYDVRWFRFDNARGTAAPVGPAFTASRPAVPVPGDLVRSAAFVAVDVAAIHDAHPTWRQPVRVYFRHADDRWTLVGLERMGFHPVRQENDARLQN
jgi:hypothetical protein